MMRLTRADFSRFVPVTGRAALVVSRTLGVGALLGLFLAFPVSGAEAADELEASLREHVEALCGEGLEGRGLGSPGLDRAADYVEDQLRALALQPAFGASYRQAFEGPEGEALVNLAGVLPAEGAPGATGHLVVGAHYDGQGKGEKGDANFGLVHPSADDNASGVAALLEAVRIVKDEFAPLDRPVVFVAFTGEEIGRLGSLHYAAHPALPLDEAVAMINLDTIGRVAANKLSVFGVASGAEFASAVKGVNYAVGFELDTIAKGSGASDDTSFREKGIASLHLFSGAHPDYHRPTDTPDKLEIAGLARVTQFTAELVEYLTRADTEITFVPEGAAEIAAQASAGSSGKRKVTFGSIPDFNRESGGVLLTGVLPNSPAEKAGLQAGDIILEFGGSPVDNLLDYSEAMKRYAPGDEVVVRVRRGEDQLAVTVTLVERK
jgi:Zn-dependent M28 family amino/carboxypeptidase